MAAGDFVPHDLDPEIFDLGSYMLEVVGGREDLLAFPEFRKAVSRLNALAFAMIYCRHLLQGDDTGNQVTMSDFHLHLYSWASQEWVKPLSEPKKYRDIVLGPRNIGKTTTLKILFLWALLHGHAKFLAIFSASEDQSRFLIESLTEELRVNPLIRSDFPEHAKTYQKLPPEMRVLEQDRVDFLRTRGGAVIVARSVTASVAGLNVSGHRPDIIALDDIEQTGESYSPSQAKNRLTTVLQSIFPLRLTARVVITGTAQLVGSIMHEAVRSVETESSVGITVSKPVSEDAPDWLNQMNVTIRWFRPLVYRSDGTRRSIWPEMWSTEFLESIEGTREFSEVFDNSPWVSSGVNFAREYFHYCTGRCPCGDTHRLESSSFTVLSVDPARTARSDSDYTGVAVVSYSKAVDKFEVLHAEQKRMDGNQLRAKVLALLSFYPNITSLMVEVNTDVAFASDAGIFHALPVPVVPVRQMGGQTKPVRYEQAALEYFHGRVLHRTRMPLLEGTLVSWSADNKSHDDISDAVITAILEIRKRVNEGKQARPLSVVAGKTSYAGFYNR